MLREDPYQRQVVQRLEDLHNKLKTYEQKVQPEPEISKGGIGFLSRIFGGRKKQDEDSGKLKVPDEVVKGLYLYGDVGTGKR